MSAPFTAVLPFFALIFAGWSVRRLGVLGAAATRELNRFVVHLALPALLFDLLAQAPWRDIWQPRFIAAFGLSAVLVFGLSVLAWTSRGRSLADAAVASLNAAYSNTGFLGLPLLLAVLGRRSAPSAVVATILLMILMSGATVLVELDASKRGALRSAAVSLLRSPLMLATAAGACISAFGLHLPDIGAKFTGALAAAATPCALLTLGMFFAEPGRPARRDYAPAAFLVGLKLVVQPALAWGLAWGLGLPPHLVRAAVLLAALPTGTGPFMLATLYEREMAITSNVVMVSTAASLLTMSALLSVAM